MECILQKLTKVMLSYTGVEEMFQDQFLNPWDRIFFMRAFTNWTGLTPVDFYQFDANGDSQTYANLLDHQITVLTK
jgi:hypothetical protein